MFGQSFLPTELGNWVVNNRTTVVGIAFFGNMIASQLTQTGAFEVYLDGTRVFSKLEMGRIPELMELVGILRAAMPAA